jgi:hypothetical protein
MFSRSVFAPQDVRQPAGEQGVHDGTVVDVDAVVVAGVVAGGLADDERCVGVGVRVGAAVAKG